MRRILTAAGTIAAFGIAGIAFAQTALPEGVTEEQMNSAFKDLSSVYGAPVVRLDQAKAICNEEKYIVDCAEIGKRHELFPDERTKQVDALLSEFKGDAVEKMKACTDVACLVDVAMSIASRLGSRNPAVAKTVELTVEKVKEKRSIVETAKSIGVDFEACRTMDPETASVELLRSCARLAKHENVQKYVSQEVKDRAKEADATIDLKENLASGQVSCGDNTLEGCGNFCLKPPAEAQEKGVAAIPPVCRQIASRFFGAEGVKELERAYTTVQETFDTLAEHAENIVFEAPDGRTLADPASIGRYLEEEGSRGNVEAVTRGMDFLVKRGFVNSQDRDFAITMVGKIKERGPVDFDVCRDDPSRCADLISEKDRGQFNVMGEVEKIMRSEMTKRGIADPSRCSVDQTIGQACLDAARAALPQMEILAGSSPEARPIISDIRQKIRFGEAGFEARSRVEERFKTEGDFSMGDRRFGSFTELEGFCKTNSEQCLSETARDGIFSRDVAAEKYERVIEVRYGPVPQVSQVPQENMRGALAPANFNKEEALQQFREWLDNPQGPPPMPPPREAGLYSQYSPYPPNPQYAPYPQNPQYPQYPTNQYSPYPRQQCAYPMVFQPPCKAGEYRQESVNEFGCSVFGACIPFATKTEPPRPDGMNICPAMPTVESCRAGEIKEIAFSSPECGTYYTCRSVSKPPIQDDQNRVTADCGRYGSGWRALDESGNCFSSSMTEYRTANGTLYSCSAFPAYGCSATDVPPMPTPMPVPPSGQREQVWNSSGLRSWVRADADQARIDSLKQACANVSSQANVWMPGAGTQSSTDFGMPDSAKCARAAACTSAQYFDGAACVASISTQQQQSCGYNEYWSGSACVPSTTQTTTNTMVTGSCSSELIGLLGSGCHSMGGGWFSEDMTRYVLSNSQIVRSCAVEYVSGCSGGSTQTSCPSGQYWNGTACVTSTTSGSTYGSECRSQSSQSACSTVSGCYWYTGYSGSYCDSAGSAATSGSSCPSGQYWNGSSCVTSTTQTSCGSGQYWNGSSCVTSTTQDCPSGQYVNGACAYSSSTTACPSGQYWNGSSCVTTSTTDCTSGQYWNGSSCVSSTETTTTGTSGTYSATNMAQDCANAGGTWDSAANYCNMPSSSSTYTAPSSSGTYTPPADSTYTAPSSGTYTAPADSTYTAPSTESYTPPPTTTESAPVSYLFCPEGHDWNGAYCTLSPPSTAERYMANVWSALRSLFSR